MKFDTYDDFRIAHGWPAHRWVRFRTAQCDLWDPTTEIYCPGDPERGLTLSIPRFTISCPPHHVKALTLSSATFNVESWFAVRAEMAVNIHGTDDNPFGAAPDDPRLAAAALVVIDVETGMVLDFFVSNGRICTIYERLPLARTQNDPYAAFTALSDTGVQTSPGQWHTYEIRYHRSANRAEWLVDGVCVAWRNNVGAAPRRTAAILKLNRLRFGGGLFTLLDDLRDDLERADDNRKIPGLDPSGANELFGQGGTVRFRSFAVGRSPDPEA